MFNSFSRSATSGWTVVIGVPKAIMMAEIRRWLWWTIAGTALLSLTGIPLALLMARRIAGSIQGLIAPALALGRGESVAIGHLELAETNEAGESLVKASQLIQQRAAERERAEAARREAEELKRFNAELERSEAEARARAAELAITEKQFQATAERLKAILENAPVGIVINNRECRLIESNAAYLRICGYSAEELKDKKFTDYTHPDDIAKNLQLYEQLRSDKLQSYEMEKRYIRKDGKTIWVRVIASRTKRRKQYWNHRRYH